MAIQVPATLLKKASDSVEVQTLLTQLGASAPRLKKGDVDTNVNAKPEGIWLVFSDEAYQLQRKDIAIGEGALVLSGVTFVAAGYPDFQPYTGQLPLGVKFDYSPQQMHTLLGTPEWSNPGLGRERWEIDGIKYIASYTDEGDKLLSFSMELPSP